MSDTNLTSDLLVKVKDPEKELNVDLFNISSNEFKKHIEPDSNKRIIFSGKFGSGKSSFLNYFFEKNEIKKLYVSIHISPVNYVVSSNQDVFELIKFDILLGLFKNDVAFECDESSKFEKLNDFCVSNFTSLFSKILDGIGLLGSGILGDNLPVIINVFKFVLDNFKEEYECLNKKILDDEVNNVDNFINSVVNKIGSSFDESLITDIITKRIQELKGDGKKAVLIIDDLDRLDPEHIFRIINIFGCHLDYQRFQDNIKFGFDKIVLVCDVRNIKSVFHHKYGVKAHFEGYIDKYYSESVFEFSIDNKYVDIVDYFISKFTFTIKTHSGVMNNQINNRQINYIVRKLLKNVLLVLIQTGLVSIRNVSKINCTKIDISTQYLGRGLWCDKSPFLIIVLELLRFIVGDNEKLLKYLKHNFSNINIANNLSMFNEVFEYSGVLIWSNQHYKLYSNYSQENIVNLLYYEGRIEELNPESEYPFLISKLFTLRDSEFKVNILYVYYIVLEKLQILSRSGYVLESLNDYKNPDID